VEEEVMMDFLEALQALRALAGEAGKFLARLAGEGRW
jgi:hypothetical protein